MKNLQFLLSGFECKANHPITCLNPEEWFTPIDIRNHEYPSGTRYYVRGENTAWFNVEQMEIRKKSNV